MNKFFVLLVVMFSIACSETNAAGIFRFETTDGRRVVSSFCHGEAKD